MVIRNIKPMKVNVKVNRVVCLPPPLEPWIPALGDVIRDQFGAKLQEPECERWWIFSEDWECAVWTDLFGVIWFTAKCGAGLDLASIPGLLESMEKRDDRTGLISAVIHDINFATQILSFEESNDLFHQINRLHGMGMFRAWRRRVAVSSPAGRAAWDRCSMDKDLEYERRWFGVKWSDK